MSTNALNPRGRSRDCVSFNQLRHVHAEPAHEKAEARYRELVAGAQLELAAEALYWSGVSNYKRTHDGAVLTETARQMRARFAGSSWMKKASVWEK